MYHQRAYHTAVYKTRVLYRDYKEVELEFTATSSIYLLTTVLLLTAVQASL